MRRSVASSISSADRCAAPVTTIKEGTTGKCYPSPEYNLLPITWTVQAPRSARRARSQRAKTSATGAKATTSAAMVQNFMEVRGSAALKPSGCSRVSCTIRITVWPPGVNNHPTKTRATQATEMPKRTDPDIRESEFIDGPPNGSRLSCGAELKGSQTEFYYAAIQEVHRMR